MGVNPVRVEAYGVGLEGYWSVAIGEIVDSGGQFDNRSPRSSSVEEDVSAKNVFAMPQNLVMRVDKANKQSMAEVS